MSPIRHLSIATILLAAGAAGAADTYDVDGDHSAAIFKINHMGVSNVYGRFDAVAGAIGWDAADPTKSTFSYTIKADSIDTNAPKRDQHLKSGDFFDAKQFPELTFKSTAIKKVDDKTFDVTGDLSIHGETKPVTVKVVNTGAGKGMAGESRIGFETTFTIKRSDYGMGKMVPAIGDEVQITVSSEAVKK